ncbi:hypothetical protein ABW19_dt0203229 [Dactylella cylindrospora]|nr:hypothetical protein ABW19_dt0203229 [Dactylella cylindrospora]
MGSTAPTSAFDVKLIFEIFDTLLPRLEEFRQIISLNMTEYTSKHPSASTSAQSKHLNSSIQLLVDSQDPKHGSYTSCIERILHNLEALRRFLVMSWSPPSPTTTKSSFNFPVSTSSSNTSTGHTLLPGGGSVYIEGDKCTYIHNLSAGEMIVIEVSNPTSTTWRMKVALKKGNGDYSRVDYTLLFDKYPFREKRSLEANLWMRKYRDVVLDTVKLGEAACTAYAGIALNMSDGKKVEKMLGKLDALVEIPDGKTQHDSREEKRVKLEGPYIDAGVGKDPSVLAILDGTTFSMLYDLVSEEEKDNP